MRAFRTWLATIQMLVGLGAFGLSRLPERIRAPAPPAPAPPPIYQEIVLKFEDPAIRQATIPPAPAPAPSEAASGGQGEGIRLRVLLRDMVLVECEGASFWLQPGETLPPARPWKLLRIERDARRAVFGDGTLELRLQN